MRFSPSQNHLLELKIAAMTALPYSEVWKLFGLGRHENFRELLISHLSPHMSSLAFQYWLQHGINAFEKRGLYYTGGSRHALNMAKWLFSLCGLSGEVRKLCAAETLAEQREIWNRSLRKIMLNRTLSRLVVGKEKWLWKALGVPPNQRNLIEHDFLDQDDAIDSTGQTPTVPTSRSLAIFEYAVNTLDPVISSTLLSEDNAYYLLCLQGQYSRRCHPDYLTPKAHVKLSAPGAFDGLRIHTDELCEVIARMNAATLTIAIVMDSMDWFDPDADDARRQVEALNRALKMKGRVLLRSAGLTPWYVRVFEEGGFVAKRVAARMPGTCIDR
jgi:betaine lipid synthase